MEAPKEFKDLIGTTQLMGGGLFGRKETPMEEYKVLDWRWGSAQIMDMKTLKVKHPTIELLVKKDGMKASRWTKGFPCRSIELTDED
jgi:hypothetical protein